MTARPADGAPDLGAKVDEALTDYVSRYTDPRWQEYLAMHPDRYRFLIARIVELLARLPPRTDHLRLLVIGPRFEVDLIRRVAPGVSIDTLGLNPGLYPPREGERQFIFDLSNSDDPQARPQAGPYELIVMAEVLEHVPMPPSIVLPWLRSLLVPDGYLVIQTPNAVALPNRVRMLAGRQPFQMLSVERDYPGHFREYTIAELVGEGNAAGFEIADVLAANYFSTNKRSNRIFRRFERIVPKTLRAGITIIYRAPARAR